MLHVSETIFEATAYAAGFACRYGYVQHWRRSQCRKRTGSAPHSAPGGPSRKSRMPCCFRSGRTGKPDRPAPRPVAELSAPDQGRHRRLRSPETYCPCNATARDIAVFQRRGAGTPRQSKLVHDPPNAFDEITHVEIDKQSNRLADQTKVRKHLRTMDRQQGLH